MWPCALGLLTAGLLTACGGSLPFTSSGLGDVDKAFLAAAPSWDMDRDGTVTCQDWTNYLTSLFQAADKNRDGVLTADEYKTIAATDRMFETVGFSWWDSKKQGRLTLADMTGRPNPAFVLVDKNKDCVLDRMEVLAAESASDRPRANYAPPPDPQGGDTRKGGLGK